MQVWEAMLPSREGGERSQHAQADCATFADASPTLQAGVSWQIGENLSSSVFVLLSVCYLFSVYPGHVYRGRDTGLYRNWDTALFHMLRRYNEAQDWRYKVGYCIHTCRLVEGPIAEVVDDAGEHQAGPVAPADRAPAQHEADCDVHDLRPLSGLRVWLEVS